jgi:hypothetical protein
MIHLTKGAAPEVLIQNAATWTKALTDKIDAGVEPTNTEKYRYRHVDIKDALVTETHGKCAYCESLFRHVHHGDVEHIYPKSLDPKKTFDWENLTLACEICNQNKSDKDPYLTHIIDPYIIDPEAHLIFIGGVAFSKGTPQGTSTGVLLDLNRPALVEQRQAQLIRIMAIFEKVNDANLPLVTRRAIYQDLANREVGPQAQYSAMGRCVVNFVKPTIDPQVTQGL